MQAFVDPYLVACRLPYKRRLGCTTWPGDGVCVVAKQVIPYGMDRLTVLWAATMASARGLAFRFRPRDIARMFGAKARRDDIVASVRRVAQSYVEIARRENGCERLAICVPVAHLAIRAKECEIELGAQFAPERLMAVSREVIAGCVEHRSMAALDLYLWQMRAAHSGAPRAIPVFGDGGLLRQLGWNYRRAPHGSRARQLVRQRQALIQTLWPACPHVLAPDGNTFLLRPMESI